MDQWVNQYMPTPRIWASNCSGKLAGWSSRIAHVSHVWWVTSLGEWARVRRATRLHGYTNSSSPHHISLFILYSEDFPSLPHVRLPSTFLRLPCSLPYALASLFYFLVFPTFCTSLLLGTLLTRIGNTVLRPLNFLWSYSTWTSNFHDQSVKSLVLVGPCWRKYLQHSPLTLESHMASKSNS